MGTFEPCEKYEYQLPPMNVDGDNDDEDDDTVSLIVFNYKQIALIFSDGIL